MEAVKYTVMMNMAPIFLRNSLQLGTHACSTALRAALLQWCYSSRNFGANGTSADDDNKMQVDSGRKTAGIPVEERTTIPPAEIVAKARVNTQAKGKANTWTLSKQSNLNFLKQPRPCRILRKIRVLLENSRAFQAGTSGSSV